ncbi:MAG: hypothetical protein KIS92_02090 [Planctomycetota bacterium]|nr:hypothetical protein [Planctomycetota bacterium]
MTQGEPPIPESIGQAHWQLDGGTPAISAARIFRFHREIEARALTLNAGIQSGGLRQRHAPAWVRVHAWDDARARWSVVAERKTARAARAFRMDLGGRRTRTLLAECLRQHPPEPNCREQWSNPRNVPYFIFDKAAWDVRARTPFACEVPVAPALRVGSCRPRAARGQRVFAENDAVHFSSPRFSASFSLRRPLLMHLGWDAAAGGKSSQNLLFHRTAWAECCHLRLASGPLWNSLDWEVPARLWGGRVDVLGNVVRYRGLHPNGELELDATFEVRPDGMDLRLRQRTKSARATVDLEAWRFVWNGRVSAVATCGLPVVAPGRTGAVRLPAYWTAPGFGNLACTLTKGGPARLQVDTWRAHEIGWAGVVLGHDDPLPATFVPPEGECSAELSMRVLAIEPNRATGAKLHPELLRNWGAGLMFRPELGGFSNNAISCNCHLSQTGVTDLAAATRPPAAGPDPVELARHTVTLALKDGRGYGDSRDIYLDSDPSLLNAAGRVEQVRPDAAWLREVWPFARAAMERILAKIDRTGLMAAPKASGNYGAEPTIANAFDTINFGHYDAYSNAEAYRALRNAAGLASAANDEEVLRRAQAAARALARAYARCFYNPRTGWLGSWRSRDGELHDYGLLCSNAAACLYGLVPRARAKRILGALERKRRALKLDNFRWGLPMLLLPVRRGDHQRPQIGAGLREDGRDAFGIFCNGSLTLGLAQYYIRALSLFGFTRVADRIAKEVLEGHALGRLVGGVGSGLEFHTPEGIACGYEGAYVLQFPALLAIAQHLGLAELPQPEFWLEPRAREPHGRRA